MAHNALVNGVLRELELTACNFLANVIDDCHGMTLYLKRILPTQYLGVSCTVRGRTLALTCCRKRERRRRGGWRQSGAVRGSATDDENARLSCSRAQRFLPL